MTWQTTILYVSLTIVPAVLVYSVLSAMGIFRWIDGKINGPRKGQLPPPKRDE